MDFDNIKNNDKTLNFSTGISKIKLLKWLISLIKPNFELASKSNNYENHLLIVLMKLICRISFVLDLIQMLPMCQRFSELSWKLYQILLKAILYAQKGKHYVEIYHLLSKTFITVCV